MTMKCDQCGLVIKDWDWHRFKYCPNCGADMRGGQEEPEHTMEEYMFGQEMGNPEDGSL